MIEFGSILMAEASSERLSQRIYPDAGTSLGYREWLGFRMRLCGDILSFPFELWIPTADSSGSLPPFRDCVGFMPKIVLNGDGTIDIFRAGLPPCRFSGGFCEKSQETLRYDSAMSRYVLNSVEGVRYEFASNAGTNPVLDTVTFPSGVKYTCTYNGPSISFNAGGAIVLSISLSSLWSASSITYKAYIDGSYRTLFSMAYDAATSNQFTISYSCQALNAQGGNDAFSLSVGLPAQTGDFCLESLAIPGFGAPVNHESVYRCGASMLADAFLHDRVPQRAKERLIPLEGHLDPFLALSRGFAGSEDEAYFALSGPAGEGRVVSSFSNTNGLCGAVRYEGGRASACISSVPFVPFVANAMALNQNAFFGSGFAYWSSSGGASIADIEDLPDCLALWPTCRSGETRRCAVLPSGAALTKIGSTSLFSDAPYAFCFLLAADAVTCSSPSTVSIEATIYLNGGGTAQRTVSLGKGGLCPNYPSLAFIDLSSAEGATGYSLSIRNQGAGTVAIGMGALFPLPVRRFSFDPSTGLAVESVSGTSYSKTSLSSDLPTQSVGELSSPLQSYDASRRPTRAASSDGSVTVNSYLGESSRVAGSALTSASGGLSEELFKYSDPWNSPSQEASPYGWTLSRAMGQDGSISSATICGTTASVACDSRDRPTSISFAWSGGSASHAAAYSGSQTTLSVGQVSGSSVALNPTMSGTSTLNDARGDETIVSLLGHRQYPESVARSGAGSASWSYDDVGVMVPGAITRNGATQIDQVALTHDEQSGSTYASVGPYYHSSETSPALGEAEDEFSLGQIPYLKSVGCADPAFSCSSQRIDAGGLGESNAAASGAQEPRCSDYPSVYSKGCLAGSSSPDYFAVASAEAPSQGMGFAEGVPCLTSSAIWTYSLLFGQSLAFAALVRFSAGCAVMLNSITSLGASEVFRYQNGTVYVSGGSVSTQWELLGWHCLALSVGADGLGTLFVDDARIAISLGATRPIVLSMAASQPVASSVVLSAASRWGDEELYEFVRDCLGIPIPSSAPRSYSSVVTHSASPSETLASYCDFDGHVLLGIHHPRILSGVRRVHPIVSGLSSDYGGPRRSPRFRYDAELGRKCWVCSGELLAYPTSGKTVCLRMKVKPFHQLTGQGRRYLFAIGKQGTPKVSCFLQNGTIRLETLGVEENTGVSLQEGVWTTVSFRFVTSVSSSGSSSPETISVAYGVAANGSSFSNGRVVSYSIDTSSPLYVGTEAGTSIGLASHPLLGMVGELWLTPRDYSLATVASISSRLKQTRFEARLDSFGRVQSHIAWREGSKFVEESFSYDAPSVDLDQTGPRQRQTQNLVRHVAKVNGQTAMDESLGRDPSTGKLASYGGQSVEYYGSGFLKKALGEEFSYHQDGAICARTKGGITRTYSYDSYRRLTDVSGICHVDHSGGSMFPCQMARTGSSTLGFTYFDAGKVRSVSVGSSEYVYDYDESGKRFRKSLPGGGQRVYRYDGDLLAYESVPGSWAISYGYDSLGRPAWLDHFEGSARKRYYFLVDAMGRISKLLDDSGATAVSFSYDALGLPSVQDQSGFGLASRSSLRYKGYVYEHESGLYFLGFRLYDPSIGMFLSPDSPSYLDFSRPGGLNLYVHCFNNPLLYADHTGRFPVALLISTGIGALLGAIGGTAGALITDYKDNGSIDNSIGWKRYFGSILGGAISGAGLGFAGGAGVAWLGPLIAQEGSAAAALGGLAASTIVSFIGGSMGYSVNKWISGDPCDPCTAVIRGALTAVEGVFAFGAGGASSLVHWEGDKVIRIGSKSINLPEKICQNFVSDIFGNPSGWLLDLIMDYFYD